MVPVGGSAPLVVMTGDGVTLAAAAYQVVGVEPASVVAIHGEDAHGSPLVHGVAPGRAVIFVTAYDLTGSADITVGEGEPARVVVTLARQ